jgi:hypothetical protein
MYVFICGDNRNTIDFMYKLDKPDYFVKLSFLHHAKRIQTEYHSRTVFMPTHSLLHAGSCELLLSTYL